MFVLSDGKKMGFNPLYPIIPMPFPNWYIFESKRVLQLMPFYILIDILGMAAASILLFTDISLPKYSPTFLSGGLLGYIIVRIFLRKSICIPKESLQIIGPAPKIVWIENILVCVAFSLTQLVNAKISHLALFGDNIWSVFACLGFFAAVFPFINYYFAYFRKR